MACGLITADEAAALLGQATADAVGTVNSGSEAACQLATVDTTGSILVDVMSGPDTAAAIAAFDRHYGAAAGHGATAAPGLGDSGWLENAPGTAGAPGHVAVHVIREGKILHVTVSAPGPMDQRIEASLLALAPTVMARLLS